MDYFSALLKLYLIHQWESLWTAAVCFYSLFYCSTNIVSSWKEWLLL